ncbi:putative transcriptional regulator, GntR family protein [Longimycelium tulufanense]|uniref:Putative transcriptional regulator, GntR family protein n=1 Tax=Longimycelium tulufanense TaxID=907463 RepID=A0A8J3FTJ6_9PSEU|nr:GntR family transcriptional regulator [Longimycelium tulufanense]GGM50174.1 putative transcriptional regulator, GntR family protein [Longimycelium tulufanense]
MTESRTGGAPSATERAYAYVKARLLDGSYPDGELLSEGEVAADLEMSRTPVREAFLRLQSEGFLRLYPKRGALVVPISPGEAQAVLEARLVMEGFAIDKLAARGSEALRDVGATLSAQPAAIPTEMDLLSEADRHTADRDFHARLVAAAENPLISDQYDALRDRQVRITATARRQDPAYIPTIVREHAEIAEALRAGEPVRAKQLLRAHLRSSLRRLGLTPGPLLAEEIDSVG